MHSGMVALMAPPTVERRFDAGRRPWTTEDLAAQVGGFFAGRDPERTFACTEVLDLT